MMGHMCLFRFNDPRKKVESRNHPEKNCRVSCATGEIALVKPSSGWKREKRHIPKKKLEETLEREVIAAEG